MKQIKRFEMSVEPTQTLDIPFHSELLGIDLFNKKPCLRAIIDPGQRTITRTFVIASEDKDLEPWMNSTNYRGNFECKVDVGHVTLHVFEK